MYQHLIIDSVNLGYLVFNHPEHIKENKSEFIHINDKRIYKNFFKHYIEMVDFLKKKFLDGDATVTLLYDNYESRQELQDLLKPLSASSSRKKVYKEYKAQRVSQKTEFYNTLDILRYWYLISDNTYHTARVPNLEADDLVPRCIDKLGGKILLVSNDSDWCRYISQDVHTLPDLYSEPLDRLGFENKYGYAPTEGRIILNKILWGDTADNIDAVFPEMSPELKNYIVYTFDDILDFMLNSYKFEMTKPYSSEIKHKEKEIKLAFQMLSTINITQEHFNAVFTTGRDSKTMQETINRKIYGEKPVAFEFGVSVPRL